MSEGAMRKILEEACGAMCPRDNAQTIVCTLAKGHDGPHIDQRLKLAWRDLPKEYTPEDIAQLQGGVLATHAEREREIAKAMRDRAEDYDRVQGALARSHEWALEEARAWSMFASAAKSRGQDADSCALMADSLVREWRKRFGDAAARERRELADAVVVLSVEPPQ